MFKAIHIRQSDLSKPQYVYCGRGNKRLPHSPLANPFMLGSEAQRDYVCDRYQEYFDNKIKEQNPEVMEELRRIWKLHKQYGEAYLVCYCKPKRCHCDSVASFLKK